MRMLRTQSSIWAITTQLVLALFSFMFKHGLGMPWGLLPDILLHGNLQLMGRNSPPCQVTLVPDNLVVPEAG